VSNPLDCSRRIGNGSMGATIKKIYEGVSCTGGQNRVDSRHRFPSTERVYRITDKNIEN